MPDAGSTCCESAGVIYTHLTAAALAGALAFGTAWKTQDWLLKRIKRVKFSFCLDVGGMCKFWRVKNTEVSLYARHPNLRSPFSIGEINTKIPALIIFVWESLILAIGSTRYISKVANSIVRPIAVDVVNLIDRPRSVYIEPCQTMCVIENTIDHYLKMPIVPGASCLVSSHGIGFAQNPRKNSGALVVVEEFAQSLCGKINLSHAVVPFKQWFGQKPWSVSALPRLRHFNWSLTW